MKSKETLHIVGAGPVGSLLSIYLSRLGYQVEVFEKREDPRKVKHTEGRSINLALSHRGLRALSEVGLEQFIKNNAVPMKGRMIHDESGLLHFQPYGKEGEMIYSVSRKALNELLIDQAEKNFGVNFSFNSLCVSADPKNNTFSFKKNEEIRLVVSEALFGADGAFSNVRHSFENFQDFQFQTEKLSHSYKELHMDSSKDGKHQMEPNALHIWPREKFMLIALPNADGSFTCTLFLPNEGNISFSEINTEEKVKNFFQQNFPDIIPLIPDLTHNYMSHPESFLFTLHCYPWHYNHTLLIGDAAHAITPFYGQGMNAGFEDCRILNGLIQHKKENWENVFSEFEQLRKPNGDAIAELALQNFIEMRDLVADPEFILRKKIEAEIHKSFPDYLPLYTMVTFSDIPYHEALESGKNHDLLMKEILSIPEIENHWKEENTWNRLKKIVETYLSSIQKK